MRTESTRIEVVCATMSRMCERTLSILVLSLYFTFSVSERPQKPHMMLIVADDLGWNDVSWNNPSMITPNLESLARTGVILNQSYVQPICNPSRSALMTGYFPYRVGRQNTNIRPLEPTGLPLKFSILPEKLRELGYTTHIIGKWHLGFCDWKYTPTYRGFDSFFGYYNGAENHYTHSRNIMDTTMSNVSDEKTYLDLRNNTTPECGYKGTYSTDLFAQATVDLISKLDPQTPTFIYLAIQAVHGPLQNGGQLNAGGNNFPLRGSKGSIWEGGTRAAGFVHGVGLNPQGYVNQNLMHIVDWFPTLIGLAGGNPEFEGDGLDQWESLSNAMSVRQKFVYNIYDFTKGNTGEDLQNTTMRGAVRVGDCKLLVGYGGNPNGNYRPSETSDEDISASAFPIPPESYIQLFNLLDDPWELNDISSDNPLMVQTLWQEFQDRSLEAVPANDVPDNLLGNPKYFGGVWSPGWCEAE